MTAVAQEMLELADLIEKSQGLICMARNGRIVHLGAGRTNLVVTTLRESALPAVAPDEAGDNEIDIIAQIIAEKTSCGAKWPDGWTPSERMVFRGAAAAVLAALAQAQEPGEDKR